MMEKFWVLLIHFLFEVLVWVKFRHISWEPWAWFGLDRAVNEPFRGGNEPA